MTEMKFQEIINKNRCPAEYAIEHGEQAVLDCEHNGYDCRKCVGHLIEDEVSTNEDK